MSMSQSSHQPESNPPCHGALGTGQGDDHTTALTYTKDLVPGYAVPGEHQDENQSAQFIGIPGRQDEASPSTIIQCLNEQTRSISSSLDNTPLPTNETIDLTESPNNYSPATPVASYTCLEGKTAAPHMPSSPLENAACTATTTLPLSTGPGTELSPEESSRTARRYSPYAPRHSLSTKNRTNEIGSSAHLTPFTPHSGILDEGPEPLKRILFTSPVVSPTLTPQTSTKFDYEQPGHMHIPVPIGDVIHPHQQYWEWRLRKSLPVIITQPGIKGECHIEQPNRSTVCAIPLGMVHMRRVK